jgi:hypothetical protein
LGHDQRDIVVLFMRAELPNFFHDGRKQGLRGQVAVLLQCFGQSLLSELLSGGAERFGYAICVER